MCVLVKGGNAGLTVYDDNRRGEPAGAAGTIDLCAPVLAVRLLCMSSGSLVVFLHSDGDADVRHLHHGIGRQRNLTCAPTAHTHGLSSASPRAALRKQ